MSLLIASCFPLEAVCRVSFSTSTLGDMVFSIIVASAVEFFSIVGMTNVLYKAGRDYTVSAFKLVIDRPLYKGLARDEAGPRNQTIT
jgi:hypothetical protein